MKLFVTGHYADNILKEAKKLGMENRGHRRHELMLWLDPADPKQVDFALKRVAAGRKRSVEVTQEMLDRLAKVRRASTMAVPARKPYEEGGPADLQTPGRGQWPTFFHGGLWLGLRIAFLRPEQP